MSFTNGTNNQKTDNNDPATRRASNQSLDEYLVDDSVLDDGDAEAEPVEQTKDDNPDSTRIIDDSNKTESVPKDPSESPTVKLIETDDGVTIEPMNGAEGDSEDVLSRYGDIFGTESKIRAKELLFRLLDATEFVDGLNRREMVINSMLAELDAMNIETEAEAVQAYQMLLADEIQQQMVRKGLLADQVELKEFYLEWAERYMKQTNKKIESLQELQEDAEQTIRVERVDVSDGGQAMVGNFRKDDQGEGE